MQTVQHPVSEQAGLWAELSHKQEFTEKRPEILDSGSGFIEPHAHQIHHLPQFIRHWCQTETSATP